MLQDCFAYKKYGDKRCDALEETLCKNEGYCPFYKPKELLRKEQIAASKRIAKVFQIEN